MMTIIRYAFFLMCLVGTQIMFAQGTCTSTLEQEYQALMELYQSTNGASWTNNTGWSAADPNVVQSVAGWYGVTTDSEGYVVYLVLDGNNLVGNIPAAIGSLCRLQNLSLGQNQLSGFVPTEIGLLKNLTSLSLQNNQLSGSILDKLSVIPGLVVLYLQSNQFSGGIPQSISNLISLQLFHIGANNISGIIPAEIGGLINLKVWEMYSNQLTGSIPLEIRQLSNLTNLYLNNNQLSGPIPSSIGDLNNLQVLNLAQNNLTGSVPSQLGGIQYLNIANNKLNGALPVDPDLAGVWISNNQFTFSDFLPLKQSLSAGATFAYHEQGAIDEQITKTNPESQPLTLTTSIDRNTSPESIYQWFKVVNGGTPTALNTPSASGHTIVIENVSEADAGTKYYYTITNTAAPGLTLKSHDQTLQLITCTTPTIDFQSEELNGTHTFTPVFTGENCTPTFTWDFGDGTTSQDQAATHGYTATGTFTVTLTVSYDCGPCPSGQLTSTHDVTIENGFCGSIYCDEVGGVGIGTRNTEGFRLSVNGKIRASDIIKVYPQHQWSDFVFEKDYRLRPLSEVESFIKENGHLPEIPSAKEVETQGIDLGAMDAKLLQKVEELTLYLIELKKENEAMRKEINALKSKKNNE